jgi:hypothetical protein
MPPWNLTMRMRTLVLALLAIAGAAVVGFLALSPSQPAAANSIERLTAYQDRALLKQSWGLPVARLYGPGGYGFQDNASVCGPTSIADVLKSEGKPLDPKAVLAGSGITTYFGYLPAGLTLDQEAGLLHLRTRKPVAILRGLSLNDFRKELRKTNDPHTRYIVNFTREALFGRGHGHFSPILGYVAARDLVFVGDVNSDYKPWLVPTARLYAAQNTIDPDTHAKRGLLRVSAP